MELKYLNTFKTIVEEGSYIRAAERLNYTQSTITFQIGQLEQELSTSLFEKIGRKMVLTKAGENLIPYVNEVLVSVDKLRNFDDDLAECQGDLRVGVGETLLCYQLPAILKEFHSQAPKARLFLRSMNCYDIRDELMDVLPAALRASGASVTAPREAPPAPHPQPAAASPAQTGDAPPWEEPPLPEEEPPLPEEAPPLSGDEPVPFPEAPVLSDAPKSRPAMPAVPAAPAVSAAPAMPQSGNVWLELAESCKGQLPPMYRAFLDRCRGTLEGDLVTVYAPDDMTKNRLDNDRVTGALQENAQKLSGAPVRVMFQVGQAPQVTPEERMKNLIDFGSQFDSVQIK